MVQALDNPDIEQRFTWSGLRWQQFKAIQASFEGVPGVRLAYCEGVLEIVGIGKAHEAIRCLIALLLGQFFLEKDIEFFPSGSFSQVVEGVVEYQADLSYCFGMDKPVPDLCIEVVITSSSPVKLQKYQRMGVAEVWFWQDGTLEVYRLQAQGHERIDHSKALPTLDLALLNRCILVTSPLEAVKEFRKSMSDPAAEC